VSSRSSRSTNKAVVEDAAYTRNLAACVASLPVLVLRMIRSLLTLSLLSFSSLWADDAFLKNPRQLTLTGKRAGEGYFSADGKKLVFQSEREAENPFYQMYWLDLESGDSQRISPGLGKTTCGWLHPNGKEVMFASTHADPLAKEKQAAEIAERQTGKQKRYAWDYDENYELWMTSLDGSNARNLTNSLGYDAEGGMSPDGKKIVFASNRHAYTADFPAAEAAKRDTHKQFYMDIYTMDADGSHVERLTKSAGYDGGPFYSGDGKHICWRRFNEEETLAEIFVMDADGKNERQVTRVGAMSWAPFFHPSGEYLVFTTNKHGFDNFELYIAPLSGNHDPVRVTDTAGFDGLASFSADGKQFTWTSNRTPDKTSQIFVAEWDHAAARQALGLGNVTILPALELGPDLATTQADIRPEDMRQHATYLASDALAGRGTGTEGEKLATDYAARCFQEMGLVGAAPNGTFFLEFTFTAGVDLGPGNRLEWNGKLTEVENDWTPLTFSNIGPAHGLDVVFAGYGLQLAADGKEAEYDSYVHLDVKDKWVLMFRYVPESFTAEQRVKASRSSSLRTKAMKARERGAKGIIVVSGPTSKVNDQLVPLSFDASLAGSGVAAISITDTLANSWLKLADKDLRTLQETLDKGEVMQGFPIPNLKLSADVDIKQQTNTGRNVLAKITGTDSTLPAVIVGAHIDHLGNGRGGDSLAAERDRNAIHHGADDNASGSAGLLEIAQWLASEKISGKFKPLRDIYFAAWSGEELGILGSANYAKLMAKELGDENGKLTKRFAAMINMDMIGRFNKSLIIQGLGSSDWWKPVLEKRAVVAGLPLTLQDDCYLPTDASTFYIKGVPIFNLFTGSHEDYHRPSDTADKLDYPNAAKIAKLSGWIVRDVASAQEAPPYKESSKPKEGQRSGFRVYLGTIPDYAQGDESGVKLSGVTAGAPAAKSGVKAGDVIVKLAGKEIKNIYEFTDIMGALKVGQPTEISVRRGTEVLTFPLTPGSRE
jgi:Tol biopolymer transport system component